MVYPIDQNGTPLDQNGLPYYINNKNKNFICNIRHIKKIRPKWSTLDYLVIVLYNSSNRTRLADVYGYK